MATRKEINGNMLKNVNIRFDYNNIFGISPECMRMIDEILRAKEFRVRFSKLTEDEFLNLDNVLPENSVPYEYLKNIDSYNYISADNGIEIQINQLFCSISQDVEVTKYDSFEELYGIIEPIIDILKSELKVSFTRIGVRKIDEVFFKKFDEFKKYFKNEIIDFALWKNFICESKVQQSFEIENKKINIIRLLDSGILNGKEAYRLYLVYDIYSDNAKCINDDWKISIDDINEQTFKLFEDSITDQAIEILKKGDVRIGDEF